MAGSEESERKIDMAVEQNPLEAWNELVEKTWNMKSAPAQAKDVEQALEKMEDPWIKLIDQLWQLNPYRQLMPVDPGETVLSLQRVWLNTMLHPERAWSSYVDFVQRYNQLMAETTQRLMGARQDTEPVIKPEKGDKRFSAPEWTENPVFDVLKQTYLLVARRWSRWLPMWRTWTSTRNAKCSSTCVNFWMPSARPTSPLPIRRCLRRLSAPAAKIW